MAKTYDDVTTKLEDFKAVVNEFITEAEKSVNNQSAALRARKKTMELTRILKAYRDYTLNKADEWKVTE